MSISSLFEPNDYKLYSGSSVVANNLTATSINSDNIIAPNSTIDTVVSKNVTVDNLVCTSYPKVNTFTSFTLNYNDEHLKGTIDITYPYSVDKMKGFIPIMFTGSLIQTDTLSDYPISVNKLPTNLIVGAETRVTLISEITTDDDSVRPKYVHLYFQVDGKVRLEYNYTPISESTIEFDSQSQILFKSI